MPFSTKRLSSAFTRSAGSDGVGLTQVGVTMGTPLYMSPEQINEQRYNEKSDICE